MTFTHDDTCEADVTSCDQVAWRCHEYWTKIGSNSDWDHEILDCCMLKSVFVNQSMFLSTGSSRSSVTASTWVFITLLKGQFNSKPKQDIALLTARKTIRPTPGAFLQSYFSNNSVFKLQNSLCIIKMREKNSELWTCKRMQTFWLVQRRVDSQYCA